MNDTNVELLENAIKKQIENLDNLTPGSKEHTEAVDALTKLQRIDSENYKIFVDDEDKRFRRDNENKAKEKELKLKEQELKFKEKQMEYEKKKDLELREQENRIREQQLELERERNAIEAENNEKRLKNEKVGNYLRFGAEVGGLVLTVSTYCRLFNKGLKFEETGMVASGMVRNLMSKFKLTRK